MESNYIITNDGVKYLTNDMLHCGLIQNMIKDFDGFGEFPIDVPDEVFKYILEYESICCAEENRLVETAKHKKEREKKYDDPIEEFQNILEEEYPPYIGGEFRPVLEDLDKPFNYDINYPYLKKRIPMHLQEFASRIPMPTLDMIGAPSDEEIRQIYGDDFMIGESDLYAIIWLGTYPNKITKYEFTMHWGHNFVKSKGDFDTYYNKCSKQYNLIAEKIGGMKKFHEIFQEHFNERYPCHNHPEAPVMLCERIAYAAQMLDLDSLFQMIGHMISNQTQSWILSKVRESKEAGLSTKEAYYCELPIRKKIREWLTQYSDKTEEEEIEIRKTNQWIYDLALKQHTY